MIFPGSILGFFAAFIAMLISCRACFLTRQMRSFRFIASAVFALLAAAMALFPTWLYASQMTDAALKRELAERGDYWRTSTIEDLRSRMSARNSSQMIIATGVSAVFSALALLSLRSARRSLRNNKSMEARA